MRTRLRFAMAAAVAALLGLQPAFAQQPEAELKKAQEQLEKLLKELKEREAKKADAPKATTLKPPAPPSVPAPPPPPGSATKPMIAWAQMAGGDSTGALKGLTASKDPKVAALAKELLEHLAKSAPQTTKVQELHLELAKPSLFVPSQPNAEFKFLALPPGAAAPAPETKTVERRVIVVSGGEDGKAPEARVTVVKGQPVEGVHNVTVNVVGTSSLKLSADGKTAALLSTDGTITIFDVASGKEVMKFAGKK